MGEVIKRTQGGRFLGYYLRFYEDGKRRQIASKQTSAAEARKMLLQIEAKIARGEVGIAEKRGPSPSVAALVERFLTEYTRPRIKDPDRYRAFAQAALRRILPTLGKLPADKVTVGDVNRARDAISRQYAAASVKLALSFLSTMFAWAQRRALVANNPCRGVERPQAESTVDFLSREEIGRLLSHTAEHAPAVYPMIATALYTGMRKGELCGLRWRDLDLRSRRLTVARSYDSTPKSGKARHLRLPDVLVPLLTQWADRCPRTDEGFVFPSRQRDGTWGLLRDSSAMKGLPDLLRAAGCRVPAHPWHALRHTFASHFIMAGGNILTLQKILGHSDVKMTLIYAHLAPDFIGEEMNRLKF